MLGAYMNMFHGIAALCPMNHPKGNISAVGWRICGGALALPFADVSISVGAVFQIFLHEAS